MKNKILITTLVMSFYSVCAYATPCCVMNKIAMSGSAVTLGYITSAQGAQFCDQYSNHQVECVEVMHHVQKTAPETGILDTADACKWRCEPQNNGEPGGGEPTGGDPLQPMPKKKFRRKR